MTVSPPTSPLLLDRVKLAPYAPVIRRTATEFQVGLDPRTALIFVGSGFGDLLAGLDGRHSAGALQALGTTSGLTVGQVTWTVNRLRDAGLIEPRRGTSRTASQVRLIGAGPIGAQLAGHLAGPECRAARIRRRSAGSDALPDRRGIAPRL